MTSKTLKNLNNGATYYYNYHSSPKLFIEISSLLENFYYICLNTLPMIRIIAKKTLRLYWEKHTNCEQHLKTWYETVRISDWQSPNDIKKVYASASILPNNRVVFNIKGNSYRLIVKFNYERQWAFIRFIGTHAEYDKIDAETI